MRTYSFCSLNASDTTFFVRRVVPLTSIYLLEKRTGQYSWNF